MFAYGRNINVNGSGIIASNAKLLATGSINGLIFARNNLDINAQHNINVTALGGGNVNVSGRQFYRHHYRRLAEIASVADP